MDNLLQKLTESLPAIIVLIALCYGLSQSRRVTNDVMNHIDKLGEDEKAKELITHKLLFNFYFLFIAVFIISAYVLKFIDTYTSLISLAIDLFAVVIKIVSESWGKSK